MSVRSLSLLGVLALLALPPDAGAAAVLQRSFEEMTARSALVVRATVVSSEARLQGQRIYTFTGLRVSEVIKGRVPVRLVVRQPGGEVGGIGQMVPGAARFIPNEDVVLFLEPAGDDASVHLASGLSAGKVRLEKRRDGTRATRDLSGITFHTEGGAPAGARPPDGEDLGSADAFLVRIRAAARGQEGTR